ncbi:MAG: hypothetical protein RLZZ142_2385 [Verrucomicrobiota bacterium]|jgi:hypothetical protein
MNTASIDRRHFLRAAGACIALPLLEGSPLGASEAAAPIGVAPGVDPQAKAKNLVCIGAFLGLHTPALYPTKTGLEYEMTQTLQPLEAFRGEFTLFSGLDHRAAGNHENWSNYLCGRRVGEPSLDQLVATRIGRSSRHASLVLSSGTDDGPPMSYSQRHVAVPAVDRPSVVYRKLFVAETETERRRTEYLLRSGRSVLDLALEEARRLQSRVGVSDRERLDQYFTSLREVEQRMVQQLSRLDEPVPKTDYRVPETDPLANHLALECEAIMLDLTALALHSNSTRVVSLRLPGLGHLFTIGGKRLKLNYHALSHHGQSPEKIEELVMIDVEHMRLLARFIQQLKEKKDSEGRSLLDRTLVMWGTGMGDASRHSNENLPTIVAGGGLKHRGHLAFQRTGSAQKDLLLGDLFITLQRQLGIACEQFSDASQSLDSFLA